MRSIRRFTHCALKAAAIVIPVIAVAPAVAQAQGKLEARYTASLAGLPIGQATWVIDIAEDHFTAAASAQTTGLMRVFNSGQGTSASHGTRSGDKTTGSNYSTTIKTTRKTDEIQVTVQEGNVKEFKVTPPDNENPELVPVTEAHRRGVMDPMTALLMPAPGTGEMISSAACNRTLPVFDGRMRYNLQLSFKRMAMVKADKGYAGPVVVCAVRFAPLGGYVPGRTAIKYLIAQHDMEIWLAPISGTRMLVPFRIEVPTPLGQGVVEADQFVATVQPPRAATKGVKTQ